MNARDRYRLGASVGQLEEWTVSTPAQQQARLDQVRAGAAMLTGDVTRYMPAAEQAVAWSQWAKSYSDWLAAFDAFRPDWADRLWGNTATQIESYAAQLEQWRRSFAQWPGAQVTGPSPGVASEHKPPRPGMHPLAILAIGAVGGLGLLTVAKLAWGSR